MLPSDLISISQWWIVIFCVGIIFAPFTNLIFPNFFDRGYIFAKVIGIALISYAVFILGFFKIFPFTETTIVLTIIVFLILNIILISKYPNILISLRKSWKIFFFEEAIFLGVFLFWSFIHAHQPEIHGLEKYMDFGFVNSILRSNYFPPADMWFTPLSINYYYFGHLVTAILTKLSLMPSSVTFNLMLATISALAFTSAFSIGANLTKNFKLVGGLLTAFILNFAGNLHAIYLFFKPYQNENPVPFWNLAFSPLTFPNNYWYPNATRFIENTIHEFPLYSYVVSDLHGHVLDIPFVLLIIAVLLSLLLDLKIKKLKLRILLISFLLAVMYMTNAWDGIIYFLLAVLIIVYIRLKSALSISKKSIKYCVLSIMQDKKFILHTTCCILLLGISSIIFTIPFNLNFKPFTSGIGVLCVPDFLTNIGKLGPFLFERDHCQRSAIWQLAILYGFFYLWAISFIIFLFKNSNLFRISKFGFRISSSDLFVLLLITFSTLLIIIPEFIYIKDIYPAHYRANTMFKLVYQSFIMLSLCSGYIIVRLFLNHKSLIINRSYWKFVHWAIGLFAVLVVFLYPYFSIKSYFGDLKKYSGLNGTNYLKTLYSNDYEAISWINKNIKNQPTVLEAQGDSYTDYGRVSVNTGLPTVLGWTVHEWLWRGSYDIPSPRIEEVTKMYESQDLEETKTLLKKYKVSLVFFGNLERQKYQNLNEDKFNQLGKIIYQNGGTIIYKIK